MLRTVAWSSSTSLSRHATSSVGAEVLIKSAASACGMAKTAPVKAKRPHVSPDAVAIPPTEATMRLTALVEHILAQREGCMSEIIAEELDISRAHAMELIRFGSVYWCPVLPHVSEGREAAMSEADRACYSKARASGIAQHGDNVALLQPKRAGSDVIVPRTSYLRVHAQPKRFPAAYSVDWQSRLVHVGEQFVVVSKPPGIPVVPCVCNILESCLTSTAQALNLAEPLLATHRLDTCTEGLVMLGRTAAFVSAFNRLQLEGAVQKFYRALTLGPPPTGTLVHHATVGIREKGLPTYTLVHATEVKGSVRCELEVLSTERVALNSSARALGWPETAYESLIHLKTGRTHQIRAQMGAVGWPLLGDTMYAALAARAAQAEVEERRYNSSSGASAGDKERTQSSAKSSAAIELNNRADSEAADVPFSTANRWLNEPGREGIGLQACKLVVTSEAAVMGGTHDVFEAMTPWWREPQPDV